MVPIVSEFAFDNARLKQYIKSQIVANERRQAKNPNE
jgi:hypothetical protein